MAQSQYMDEHAERFLNQYAATTLVRYMTSVLQFVQLCRVMHVTIADLTEAQLADIDLRVSCQTFRWVRAQMLDHHQSFEMVL